MDLIRVHKTTHVQLTSEDEHVCRGIVGYIHNKHLWHLNYLSNVDIIL